MERRERARGEDLPTPFEVSRRERGRMVHPPNTPREEPGKYGAIARDEESGVREAWMDETSTKQRVVDKPKKMSLKRRRRPPPPNTAPPEKLLRRIVRFFYDHLWIVFVAYVGVSVLCLRSLGEGDFNTNVNAAYFVAISTTTVGYGDMSPKTDKGKLFVMAFILTGVAMAGVFMTKVTDWILEAQERAMEKLTKKKQADMEADMAKLKAQVGARDGAGVASRAAEAAAERKRTKGGEVTKITPVQKALVAMTAVILSGAAVMHSIEDISFLDGCYWSVVTSTTVGYGDVTPKTVDGKIFASMYAFITIGVMAWAIGQVADASVQSQVEHGAQVKAFKLTPEWLAAQGGEKGYVDQFDFAKAMLLSMGKCDQADFDLVSARFDELDVNGDRSLDAADLLGDTAQFSGNKYTA